MTNPDFHRSAGIVELKPCPFCGSAPFTNRRGENMLGQIYCKSDDCFGPRTTALCYADSVVQWNARVVPAPAQPEQEPVAWTYRIQHRDDEWVEEVAFQQPDFSVQDLTPLYAAQPPAAPVDPKPDWCQGADAVCHHPACACVVETGPVTVNEYEGSMYELVREQAPLDWKQDQAETSRLKPSAPVEQTCPGGIDPGFEECPKCGATDEEECRAPLPSSSAASEPVAWEFRQRSGVGKGPQSQAPWGEWCSINREVYDMYISAPNKLVEVRALYTGEPQEAPEPTARDVIAWLEKRQGISWKSTIDDINCALSSIALSLSRPNCGGGE